jgi:hypothetical protein
MRASRPAISRLAPKTPANLLVDRIKQPTQRAQLSAPAADSRRPPAAIYLAGCLSGPSAPGVFAGSAAWRKPSPIMRMVSMGASPTTVTS